MFGHREDGEHRGHGGPRHRGFEIFAMRGGPFGRHFGRGGHGEGRGEGRGEGHGRGGFGDDGEGGRVRRLLMQGDLRVLVLALIEKEPRHGYEIIKHIEEMTMGFYAPSPGVVYPTLTYLEEAGFVVAEADGNKKSYAITEEGRAYLKENGSLASAILERLEAFGEKIRRRREGGPDRAPAGPELPRSLEAGMLNLREVIARLLKEDEKRASEILRQLLQLADDLDAASA